MSGLFFTSTFFNNKTIFKIYNIKDGFVFIQNYKYLKERRKRIRDLTLM